MLDWDSGPLSQLAARLHETGNVHTAKSMLTDPCVICKTPISQGEKYYGIPSGPKFRCGHADCVLDSTPLTKMKRNARRDPYIRVKDVPDVAPKHDSEEPVLDQVVPIPEPVEIDRYIAEIPTIPTVSLEISPDLRQIFEYFAPFTGTLTLSKGKIVGVGVSHERALVSAGEFFKPMEVPAQITPPEPVERKSWLHKVADFLTNARN